MLIDRYENIMPRVHRPLPIVVNSSGGRSAGDTHVVSRFDGAQLDAVAPLTPRDLWELSHTTVPPKSTQNQIAARIEAAAKLKYGG